MPSALLPRSRPAASSGNGSGSGSVAMGVVGLAAAGVQPHLPPSLKQPPAAPRRSQRGVWHRCPNSRGKSITSEQTPLAMQLPAMLLHPLQGR
jgi:hypothetical protein